MAGLDDYEFYSNLREKESPFWQKFDANYPDDDSLPTKPTSFSKELLQTSPDDNLDQVDNYMEGKEGKDSPFDRYGEVSISLINVFTENLLSHPFIVVKRQCQVNVSSYRYHLQPFTLIPTIFHLQSHQGISSLWKGIGSVLTVRGMTLALEDCLSKFTPWPKEISPHSSLNTLGQHLLLKASALALTTPFFSASLVETVQSDITSERPGIFDVFKEGLFRLLSFTQPQTGRMLPVWLLIVPTVLHGTLQYVISTMVASIASKLLWSRTRSQNKNSIRQDLSLTEGSIRLQSTFFGHLVSEIVLFPLETILHRLHLQGTRTIIDSLDAGYEVKPILTRYEGFFDCFSTTVRDEGFSGLFKGIGAVVLQYAVYGCVLKLTQVIMRDCTDIFSQDKSIANTQQIHAAPLTPGMSYSRIQSDPSAPTSLHSTPRAKSKVPSTHHSGSIDLGDLRDKDGFGWSFANIDISGKNDENLIKNQFSS